MPRAICVDDQQSASQYRDLDYFHVKYEFLLRDYAVWRLVRMVDALHDLLTIVFTVTQ